MRYAGGQLSDDLGSGQENDFSARQPGDRAAIITHPAALYKLKPCAGEKRRRILLQPAFRGNRDNQSRLSVLRRTHEFFPAAAGEARRSIHIAAPTAGMSMDDPRRFARPS